MNAKIHRIEIVVFHFHGIPDLILSSEQFKNEGGYKGIIKQMGILKDLKSVEYGKTMSYNKFLQLDAWEG